MWLGCFRNVIPFNDGEETVVPIVSGGEPARKILIYRCRSLINVHHHPVTTILLNPCLIHHSLCSYLYSARRPRPLVTLSKASILVLKHSVEVAHIYPWAVIYPFSRGNYLPLQEITSLLTHSEIGWKGSLRSLSKGFQTY